jgi:hypothetical protein
VSGCHGKTRSEGEEGVDDLEGEFSLQDCAGHKDDPQYVAESMLRAHMSYDLRRAGPLLCRSGATEMEPKIEDGASDEESGEQLTKKVLFYGLGTGESIASLSIFLAWLGVGFVLNDTLWRALHEPKSIPILFR